MCLKCGGLTIEERCNDFFHPFTVVRCLVCGFMLDRQIYKNRQLSAAKGVEMPKFLSEEHRANWIAARHANKKAKENENSEIDALAEKVVKAIPAKVNGNGKPQDWKTAALAQLHVVREECARKLTEIDTAIRAVTAL